ncbi:MAG: alanyl-tRNA synthetase [Bacteroidia bacterium]|jgi:alanyl-tRNA synthetase
MTSKEVRNAFLNFFKSKGHKVVPSAPIVVKNDPTLMFTNAGMNQFKDYFLGNKPATDVRVVDTQKCLRVSGKHNDLEEVGVDTYHHTMFEMLGNWSFGDYFKEDTIAWAWELLTEVYKLDKNRLYVTVFEGDDSDGVGPDVESEDIWKKYIDADRIIRCDKTDNFWEMGEIGPCGSCSEIHMDLRPQAEIDKQSGKGLVNKDHPQVIELWNLVFMEFNRKADRSLEALPAKHVDTGMGLERVVRAVSLQNSNYDTDLFMDTIRDLETISGKKFGQYEPTDIAFRVIADHIRALAFCIADGQLPSNTGAGYVLRRILRRAVRYGYSFLDFKEPFMFKTIDKLANQFKGVFDELPKQKDFVAKVIEQEEASFLNTLATGLGLLENYVGHTVLDKLIKYFEYYEVDVRRCEIYPKLGKFVNTKEYLHLNEKYHKLTGKGIYFKQINHAIMFVDNVNLETNTSSSINLNLVIEGKEISVKCFMWASNIEMYSGRDLNIMIKKVKSNYTYKNQKDLTFPVKQIGREFAFELYDTFGFPIDLTQLIASEKGMTVDMAGYDQALAEQKARSKADAVKETGDWHLILSDEKEEFVGYDYTESKVKITRHRTLTVKGKEKFQITFNITPFYAESGGQVGDTGVLVGEQNGEKIVVLDTQKENDLIVHVVDQLPQVADQIFNASIHLKNRKNTQKNHSATHLLHAALKQVLGDHVAQKGSLVDPKKLRFDFSHFAKVTDEELLEIEHIVNHKVAESIPLDEKRNVPYDIAIDSGVTALFGEKYGDVVRVITFGDGFSKELCGGTHVSNTGDIGRFKFLHESSVAAGVRRVEAITGAEAEAYFDTKLDVLKEVEALLGHPKDLVKQVQSLLKENKASATKLEAVSKIQLGQLKTDLQSKVSSQSGVNVLIEQVQADSPAGIKDVLFQLRNEFDNLFATVVADIDGKPSISIMISDALVKEKGWNAGQLIREWAKEVKGGGGGQPFFAQAGGADVSGLSKVLELALGFVSHP